MSSSRAVTARRAAEANTVKTPQTGGGYGTQATANRARPPGMSMGAQAAFAQAQYPPPQGLNLQQQQALNQPPRKVGLQPPSRTIGPQMTQKEQYNAYYGGGQGQQQQQGPQPHSGKLLVSDAIALVTLRLGAAEQNIIDIQEQIGDILMNGVPTADEYDEEGNLIRTGGAPLSFGAAGAAAAITQAPPSEELEALKKELDALKARLGGVEKTAKDAVAMSGAVKNTDTVVRKLTSENAMFKNQITQLTNLLNKNMGEMERKFDEMATNLAKITYDQQMMQQNMAYGVGEGYDEGESDIRMEDIHAGEEGENDAEPGAVANMVNPMWNTATPSIQTVIESDDNTPAPQPVVVANVAPELKPLEPMAATAPRRMGAASALLASTQGPANKRPPATGTVGSSTSIDL